MTSSRRVCACVRACVLMCTCVRAMCARACECAMCVQAVGMFTQSLFMPDSTQAASATVDGDVVLWDQALLPEQSMKVHPSTGY